MKLNESQLRKLIKEMIDDDFYDAGDRLPELLYFLGLNDEQEDMFFSLLTHRHDGPLSALHWIEGQIDRRLTYDEIKQLIHLLNKDGWFQP